MGNLRKVQISPDKSISQNLHDLFSGWHNELTRVFSDVADMINASERFHNVIDGFIAALGTQYKRLQAVHHADKQLYNTSGYNKIFNLDFGRNAAQHIAGDSYVQLFVTTDRKNGQTFQDSQKAVVDNDLNALTPAVASYDEYKPDEIVVSAAYDAPQIREYSELLENDVLQYTLVKRSPDPLLVDIEFDYVSEVTANMLLLDISAPHGFDIMGIQYYDDSTDTWEDAVFQVDNPNVSPLKVYLESMNPSKRFRIQGRIYSYAATARMQNADYRQFPSVNDTGVYLYVFGMVISNISLINVAYQNISYFVGYPYRVEKLDAIGLTANTVSSTNGATEFYAAIVDYDNNGNILGVDALPLFPRGNTQLTDMIVYPDPTTKQFKTCFPIDTDENYQLTLDGNIVDPSEYQIDYNTVTLNTVSDGRYAFTYTPLFVNGYALYTLDKETVQPETEQFSTVDGEINDSAATIAFKLNLQPEPSTVTVKRIFNGAETTLPNTDITVDSNQITISNFDSSAPNNINATYEITYEPIIQVYGTNHQYYYKNGGDIIVSSHAKEQFFGTKISQTLIYPIVIFRDIDNQVNAFAMVKNLQLFCL